MKKTVGILIADDMEFKPFSEYVEKDFKVNWIRKKSGANHLSFDYNENISVFAIESGVGKVNSSIAASELILSDKVDMILNVGLSGGVSVVVRSDIVIGTRFVECDFDFSDLGYERGTKPNGKCIFDGNEELINKAKKIKGTKTACFGTGDFFLIDKDIKEDYSKTFGVNAFDIETAAIASACDKFDIPFLSVRKISDDGESAVEDYREMNEKCELDLTHILFEILKMLS